MIVDDLFSFLCRDCWLDLRPYLDSAPFTMNEHASVQRAYRVFRTLGLRHLIVVNKRNQVLGIVTRHDLVSTHYLGHQSAASSHPSTARRRKKQRLQRQKRKNSINDTIGVDLSLSAESVDV